MKLNAVAQIEIATEHYWRVRTTIGGPSYDPVCRSTINEYNIRLPFSCAGHDVDDLR